MCFSVPFRIYFKDVSQIIRDCFGLNEDKYASKNRKPSEIDMGLIEAQPVSDDDSVFLHNSDEELEKTYDFMDSD